MKMKSLAVGLLMVLLTSYGAFCWEDVTHQQICIDALELCPEELRNLLNENVFELKKGAVLPKTTFRDTENHFYIVASGRGFAPDAVAQNYQRLVGILDNPEVANPKIARGFGIASFYVATVCEFPNVVDLGRQYRNNFERSLSLTSLPPVLYDGYDPIGDPRQFAIRLAKKASEQYSPAVCYDMAVNAVADFWLDAWKKAGRRASSPVYPGKIIRFEQGITEEEHGIFNLLQRAGSDASLWANPSSRNLIETIYNDLVVEWNRVYDQTGSIPEAIE